MDNELKRLLSVLRNQGALTNGVPASETFDNTTDSLERLSNNLGQLNVAATNDDMSDIATTTTLAKLRLILNRLSSNAFTATIQGGARTELDTMLAQLATYLVAAGAALSIQVNNNAARDNFEQAFEDLTTIFGADGTNVFNPTIQGSARTDLDTALAQLSTYLAAAGAALSIQVNNNTARTNFEQAFEDLTAVFGADGTNVFNPSIDGSARTDLDTALANLAVLLGTRDVAAATGAVTATDSLLAYCKQLVNAIYRLTETACADTSDPVDMTTEVADNTVISNLLTKEGDTSDYDRRTDSLEALADKQTDIEAAIPAVVSAYFSTTTTRNASVTIASVSSTGGPIKDIVIDFLLDDDAAATFTPAWYVNSIGAPLTYVVQNIPAIATIATPAADGRYRYEFPGILEEGLTLEFRIAQDNLGDATNTIEGALSYEV